MPRKKAPPPPPLPPPPPSESFSPASERELIVRVKSSLGLRTTPAGLEFAAGVARGALQKILKDAGASMRPLFGESEERVAALAAPAPTESAAVMPAYYRVEARDEQLSELAEKLRSDPSVEAAYIKPPAEHAQLNEMVPLPADAPPVSPDFTARQGYLNAAPGGIDARFAWTIPGGTGAGVGIIDIEGAWNFDHEDLRLNQGGIVAGTPINDLDWRNHGTAVVGVIGGDVNNFGVTGISPDANVRAISIFGGMGSARAIVDAANRLNPGDIILIELHRPGPRFNFASRRDQRGYIALEWWPDDFAAIQYAVSRGVIVVEAAGNGAENLDDPLYNNPATGFPPDWRNPFRRTPHDSGAILVGAGAPPPGTHGQFHGPDRSRLDFSNYGALVDAQGWGREVTTTGYGDLQGGANQENLWYTDQFSGTSSASPIVVGALACTQGVRRARGEPPLTPAQARDLLRSTGSPQQDGPNGPATQRIGNRPNLRQMVTIGPAVEVPVALYRYWNPSAGDHFYTTHWGELGPGAHGWNFEFIQCYIHTTQVPGSVPLYRYWNSVGGDHLYTTDWNELGSGRHGWVFEFVQGYVFPQQVPNTVPLYRYWNPQIVDHFYTIYFSELGNGNHGWGLEQIQCYVYAQPSGAPGILSTPPATPPGGSFTLRGVPQADGPPASFRLAR